ncbi:28S rRNA (cytosine-C(5))-methyltransferase [Musca vetustissima]|uniref:28S rRNA (cytosine-C(5))-methyltransferase n=1 Tax=Musca vetustissima TaxID=27455 RepID=UPI002AB6746B|nr:28S rRNA (cytosine-C(5))-methyltransferase [Musca vetustissima]
MSTEKKQHSIKVPTQYKRVAAVLKTALESKTSLKSLIFNEKHARLPSMQAVLTRYFDNKGAIDEAIEKSQILQDNPRLCPILCKVLVTELLLGLKKLNGESKPVQTVRAYQDRLAEALGVDTIETNKSEYKKDQKPRYVRINRNLLSIEEAHEFLASEEWRKKEYPPFENYDDFLKAIKELQEDEYMIDMHIDDLLIFHPKQKHYWANHSYARDNYFMLQDKGTALVAELLSPPAGSTVLDMCAAPGMKTIHVSNVMNNQGTIYSVELNSERYKTLCRMTEKAGCKIVTPINADALTITPEKCPGVEYILVDPSCSGSGMQNRISVHSEEKDPARLRRLAGLQITMLSHAMSAFPDVKRIAYSTCSLYEEENEQVVQRCLQLNPSFKLLSAKKSLRNKWRNVGSQEYKKIGKNCLYTRPDSDMTDGLFIAIFEAIKTKDNE